MDRWIMQTKIKDVGGNFPLQLALQRARSLDDRVPLAILDAYPAAARAVPTVVTGSLYVTLG